MPSDTTLEHSTQEFSKNWIPRAQQMVPRLGAFLEYGSFTGERKRFDRIGAQQSREKTERKAPTVIINPDMDFRWAYRRSFELPNLLDEDDSLNLGELILPTGSLVKSHSMAYARDKDDVAWQAAMGNVKTGELGTTDVALPAAQKIADGGTGLTLTKLIQANEILEDADLEDGAVRVLCITAKQITNLLNTTEVKSADYNTVKALAAGQIDTFMGFKFIKIKRLTKVSTVRSCVGWVVGALDGYAGVIKSKISERNDLSDAVQVRSTWHLGATRIYDEGVIQIDCVES